MITGDGVYGGVYALRQWAERRRCGYVLTVTSAQRLGPRPVTDWIEGLGEAERQRLSAGGVGQGPSQAQLGRVPSGGDGAKGPRLYDWAFRPYAGSAKGFRCGLLVRRSIADPSHLTFYLTHAPEGTALDQVVKIAGVRSWTGWHCHITFAMLALAHLTAVRKDAIGGCGPEKPDRGLAAADRPGDQAPDRGRDRQALPRPRTTVPGVRLASSAPTTRQACSPDTPGLEAA